jgi:hypothetical protein
LFLGKVKRKTRMAAMHKLMDRLGWFVAGTMLAASLAVAQQPANPPLVSAPWSMLNPDLAGIVSTDRSAGASLVTFNGPMPAPTSDFILRVASAQGGQIDYHGIVNEHSTWASIAHDLCAQINADPVQAAAHIACQINYPESTFFGVTHYNDNYMVVTPLTGEPLIKVNNGSLAWDAGPILFLNRSPGFGAVPPPGSNCGQLTFNAPTTQTPGKASASYVVLGCTVLNADVGTGIQGMLSIYLAHTVNGAPLLEEVVEIRPDGLYVRGQRVCTAATVASGC